MKLFWRMTEEEAIDVEWGDEEEIQTDTGGREVPFLCKEPSCDSKRMGQFRRKYDFSRHLEKKHDALLCPLLDKEQLRQLAPFTADLVYLPNTGYYQIPEGQTGAALKKQILDSSGRGKAPARKKKAESPGGRSPERKMLKMKTQEFAICRMVSTRPPQDKQRYGECSGTRNTRSSDETSSTAEKKAMMRMSSIGLSDAFGESLTTPQAAMPQADYPVYDETLRKSLPRAAIRITALKDPKLFSSPVEDPSAWKIPRDDPAGILDWYSPYPRESMIDVMILQCNTMRIQDDVVNPQQQMSEEEEEEEGGGGAEIASGFNEELSFVIWEKIKGVELPFRTEEVGTELREGLAPELHLPMGVKLNLIILTIKEVARRVFQRCIDRGEETETGHGDDTGETGTELEKLELDIELVRKLQWTGVTNEFFQINHFRLQEPGERYPSTVQLYKMARVGMSLPYEFGIHEILRDFKIICPLIPTVNLLDLTALHMLTVRMVTWRIFLASNEIAMHKEPTPGSVRLDVQWIKRFTNHGVF